MAPDYHGPVPPKSPPASAAHSHLVAVHTYRGKREISEASETPPLTTQKTCLLTPAGNHTYSPNLVHLQIGQNMLYIWKTLPSSRKSTFHILEIKTVLCNFLSTSIKCGSFWVGGLCIAICRHSSKIWYPNRMASTPQVHNLGPETAAQNHCRRRSEKGKSPKIRPVSHQVCTGARFSSKGAPMLAWCCSQRQSLILWM